MLELQPAVTDAQPGVRIYIFFCLVYRRCLIIENTVPLPLVGLSGAFFTCASASVHGCSLLHYLASIKNKTVQSRCGRGAVFSSLLTGKTWKHGADSASERLRSFQALAIGPIERVAHAHSRGRARWPKSGTGYREKQTCSHLTKFVCILFETIL